MPLLAIHQANVNETLNKLGRLGALPSRDYQLKLYIERVFRRNLEKLREVSLEIIPILSRFPISEIDLKTPISINFNFNKKKNIILNQLDDLCSLLPKSFEYEQRNFYCQLIANLLRSIELNEDELNHQQRIIALLCLQHMEQLVKSLSTLSYPNFLRSIEACLDEIILLLVLKTSQHTNSMPTASNCIKQFLEEAIGIKPELATFSSSAMQSISTVLLACLNYLSSKKEPAIYVKAAKSAYFEIFSILNLLFKLTSYEKDLSMMLVEKKGAYEAKKLSPDFTRIYDVYIGNFESNVQLSSNQLIFTNIITFTENQFLLRKSQGKLHKPLLLILDNTMSDVNEIFLPTLLNQFKNEIALGRLCVLIVHSGNKYLHLGTDKSLACLLYGYYHQPSFVNLDKEIRQKLMGNPSGSFNPDSPTILLTQAFITYASKEIFAFSPFIKYRAAYLFKYAIPLELLEHTNYFMIDSPFYPLTDKELAFFNKPTRNNTGFISIKNNLSYFNDSKIHNSILGELVDFLTMLGVCTRDGFGFNQTTKISISVSNNAFPACIRISIGTEDLKMLIQKIKYLCAYLVMINLVIKHVSRGRSLPLPSSASRIIMEEIYRETPSFLVNQKKDVLSGELDKAPLLANSSAAFFSTSNHLMIHASDKNAQCGVKRI